MLLFITCRWPIYQTSVDTVCGEMVAPRFSSSSLIHAQFQYQCSRLYRPADQSVIQTSFSSLTLVFKLQLSLRFHLVQLNVCTVCVGFDLSKGNYFQYASTLVNQRLHFDVFLPTSTHIFKVSTFQLRHSPFFTWFVLRFTSFS